MLLTEISGVLDSLSDPAFSVDSDGIICTWNTRAEKTLGYSLPKVIGKSCSVVLQGQRDVGVCVCSEQCVVLDCASRRQDIAAFEMQVRAESGRWIWMRVSVLVFRNKRSNNYILSHVLENIEATKSREQLNHEFIEIARQVASLVEKQSPLPPALPLTEKEKLVLQEFALGKGTSTVAQELGVSNATLRNHLSHINVKLQTHSRIEAVIQARQRRLI